MTPRHLLLATATLTSIAAAPALRAQEMDSLAPTIVDAERVEDEIAAVSVLSRDSLDLFQTLDFEDLSGLVPGFYVVPATCSSPPPP